MPSTSKRCHRDRPDACPDPAEDQALELLEAARGHLGALEQCWLVDTGGVQLRVAPAQDRKTRLLGQVEL